MRLRARARLSMAALGMLAALAASLALDGMPVGATDAAWQQEEHAEGELRAVVVPQPMITDCSAEKLAVIGGRITATWSFPGGERSYSAQDVQVAAGISRDLLDLITIGDGLWTFGPDADGRYITVFEGGLLNSILENDIYLALRTVGPSGWTSAWSVARGNVPLVTGVGSCVSSE